MSDVSAPKNPQYFQILEPKSIGDYVKKSIVARYVIASFLAMTFNLPA